MKITNVNVHVVEVPGAKGSVHTIIQVPTVRRTQYTHSSKPLDRPVHQMIMRVQTGEDIGVFPA